jgi:hypothetical protein
MISLTPYKKYVTLLVQLNVTTKLSNLSFVSLGKISITKQDFLLSELLIDLGALSHETEMGFQGQG